MTEFVVAALLVLPWLACAAGFVWWAFVYELWRWAL